MTKLPFVSTTDSSLQTLGLTHDKVAFTYTSLLFDFIATGLQNIQYFLSSAEYEVFAKGRPKTKC
jgi:hypothetical protein